MSKFDPEMMLFALVTYNVVLVATLIVILLGLCTGFNMAMV